MEKGKFYTVLGIDGITISHSKGMTLAIDDESADIDIDNIEHELFEEIISDIHYFMDNGMDALVSVNFKDEYPAADEIYAIGTQNEFELDTDDIESDSNTEEDDKALA